ncbi:MAG: DUF2092 domain-containing protein [Cyanobium sp. Prado107]|jgi:hypothetical protein|nr:DUF2092 domain-containing protein [Cyanobium sp. Prado107]
MPDFVPEFMKRWRSPRVHTLVPRLFLVPLSLFLVAAGANASQSTLLAQAARPAPTTRSEPPPVRYGLEPRAMATLRASSARLAAARSLSFTAVSTYESPSRLGPPLLYMTASEVLLQRPDRLRVITLGDGPASEFYYDGKAMMAFAPAENLLAMAPAPPTVDAMVKDASDRAAIYFPFTDFIVSDPYNAIADGLMLAFTVGQSKVVGQTTTDVIAVANDKVFAQIWIGTEDQLPRMIRVVYADDPARLRRQTEFRNWRLNPSIPSNSFTSARAGQARTIPFSRPDKPLSADQEPGRP